MSDLINTYVEPSGGGGPSGGGTSLTTTIAGLALAAVAAVGTSTEAARADHVHPLPTLSALGAAASNHTHTLAELGAAAEVHDHSNATQTVAGFLSTADKTKLDGVATGATNTPLGTTMGTALGTAAAGTATTAARSDHVHPLPAAATQSVAGLMSSSDKTKLDGIATGAAALASAGTPSNLGTAALGTATTAARADHVHNLPPVATQSVAGLLSAADKTKLDGIDSGAAAVGSTAGLALTAAGAAGTASTAARSDHTHPFPTAANVGALPAAGGTMSGTLNLNNQNITNVNHLTFMDPGPSEGLEWLSSAPTTIAGWLIFDSPDDLTTNSDGDLQLVTKLNGVFTRRATFRTNGALDVTGAVTATSFNSITGLSSTVGAALAAAAAVGTGTTAARADHVHPFPTAANVGALPIGGGTLTGKLNTKASTASSAGLNIGIGATMTSGQTNGDLWMDGAGFFFRFNAITYQVAYLASPAFTGNPTAPTQATADSSTKLATTAFVQAALAAGPNNLGTGTLSGSNTWSASQIWNNGSGSVLNEMRAPFVIRQSNTGTLTVWHEGAGAEAYMKFRAIDSTTRDLQARIGWTSGTVDSNTSLGFFPDDGSFAQLALYRDQHSEFLGALKVTTDTAGTSRALTMADRNTWGNGVTNYATIHSIDPLERVMLHWPHIPYLAAGTAGISGTAAVKGAIISFAANTTATATYDLGVHSDLGADTFSIRRGTTNLLRFTNTGAATFASTVTGTSFNSITGLASVAAAALGTAAVGTSTLAARQDHVHAIPGKVVPIAGDITPDSGSRTVTNGTGLYTYGYYGAPAGAPSTYGEIVSWGQGTAGHAEMAVSWSGNPQAYIRSLRDTTDNWTAWVRLLNTNDLGSNVQAYNATLASLAAGTMTMTSLPQSAYKASAKVATTAALTVTATATTLTNSGALAALAIDGVTLAVGDRVLVKNQATAAQNGLYTVTNAGSTTVAWVLTRAADADTSSEIASGIVPVDQGTANGGDLFTTIFKPTDTLGTTAMSWYKVVDQSDASSVAGLALGTAAAGTSLAYARADHVHPTTGLALLAGATFTGSVVSNRPTGGQWYFYGSLPDALAATLNSNLLASLVSGEANARFLITGDGIHRWGPGGATGVDVAFYRTAASAMRLDGLLDVYNPSGGNYNEGIRIHPAPNGWATIALGAVAGTTGTGVGQWGLHRSASNSFILRDNAKDVITAYNAGDLYITPTGAIYHGNHTYFSPGNALYVGNFDFGAYQVWATSHPISSDKRGKKDIADTDLGLGFVRKLKSKKFQYLEKHQPLDKGRQHHGFVAQDLIAVLADYGYTPENSGFLCYDEQADRYGIDYGKLVAPLYQAVQELAAKVEALEARGPKAA